MNVEEQYLRLEASIEESRRRVVNHQVYNSLHSVGSLRVFMGYHVFAVWDFMSLLKRLQQDATCQRVAWYPTADRGSRRMINEIVLGEESDEIAPGKYQSHLELYIEAMEEVGSSTKAIKHFLVELKRGTDPGRAIQYPGVPVAARAFSEWTWGISKERTTHEVAAAFLFGREDLIPDMFRSVLDDLGAGAKTFRLYLDRHIELDEGSHGPLAKAFLMQLCGDREDYWRQACAIAKESLNYRERLWDGVIEATRQ